MKTVNQFQTVCEFVFLFEINIFSLCNQLVLQKHPTKKIKKKTICLYLYI